MCTVINQHGTTGLGVKRTLLRAGNNHLDGLSRGRRLHHPCYFSSEEDCNCEEQDSGGKERTNGR
jgi:hypothetical protein